MQGEQLRTKAEFRILPDEPGKAVRIVRFFLMENEAYIDCFDEATRECCPSNYFSKMCSHVNKAIELLLAEDQTGT